jgi:hypothetical protein
VYDYCGIWVLFVCQIKPDLSNYDESQACSYPRARVAPVVVKNGMQKYISWKSMGFNATSFLGAEVAPGHHDAMLC